jgi:uncharacterized protein YkwD
MRTLLVMIALATAAIAVRAAPADAQATCTSLRQTNTVEEAKLVALMNQFRADNRLGPLTATPALTRAAVSHSDFMAGSGLFQHDDVFTTSRRFEACGNGSGLNLAENIAGGNADALATFNQFKNSPEHRANMLGAFVAVGVGESVGTFQGFGGFPFWTVEFGSVVDGTVTPPPVPIPVPVPVPVPQPPPNPGPQSVICYAFGTLPASAFAGVCPFGTIPHVVPAGCLAEPFPFRQECQ